MTPTGLRGARAIWIIIFAVLLVFTAANLAWTFRESLPRDSVIRKILPGAGVQETPLSGPFRDLQALHLVSRDMHRHPQRAGMLALSIVFVNRAREAQPYPSIEVTLTGAANQPLARRIFTPEEYMQGSTLSAEGLPPDVHVPVLLEFTDPDGGAVGYELNFR